MRNVIIKIWNKESTYAQWILHIPLGFLSYLYQIGLTIREYLYKSGTLKIQRAFIPVISVGNISVGGTGKTPIVERVSQKLRDEGLYPGIITRGYKRKRKGTFVVNDKNDVAMEVGDEAFMLARKTRLPVIVGTNRLKAIDAGIEKKGIDIAVLDDGFQVRNLRKDVELLVLNGNERQDDHELFPLGPYREPFMRIRECDAILLNKNQTENNDSSFIAGIPTFRVFYKPAHIYNLRKNLISHYAYLQGKRVTAFAGLGNNAGFFRLLKSIGADVVHEVSFSDHHRYTLRDIKSCTKYKDIDCIVTTEKDAVKLLSMDVPDHLFYLSIETVIENEEKLLGLVLKKIGIQPRSYLQVDMNGKREMQKGSPIVQ